MPITERISANSSTWVAIWGKISETSMPHCPYFLKVKGLGIRGPGFPCRTTISPLPVSGCPAYLVSAGLGSKVSMWLTPPLMNKEMTLLARGAKCGGLGDSGVGMADDAPTQELGCAARSPS